MSMIQPPKIFPLQVQQRNCGPCKACCTEMAIPSINKPAGSPCSKLCKEGCSVHHVGKPEECKGFLCNYLIGDGLTYEERPDKIGLMFYRDYVNVIYKGLLICHELWEGARDSDSAKLVLWKFAQTELVYVRYLDNGELLGRTMLGPEPLLMRIAPAFAGGETKIVENPIDMKKEG